MRCIVDMGGLIHGCHFLQQYLLRGLGLRLAAEAVQHIIGHAEIVLHPRVVKETFREFQQVTL